MRQTLEVEEAVPLGVVGLAPQHAAHEAGNELGVHLAVAVDLHDDGGAVVEGQAVAGEGRAAHALVFLVEGHAHPRVAALPGDVIAAALGALVVHDVDRGALGADAAQDVEDVAPHAEAGHDHHDPGGRRRLIDGERVRAHT